MHRVKVLKRVAARSEGADCACCSCSKRSKRFAGEQSNHVDMENISKAQSKPFEKPSEAPHGQANLADKKPMSPRDAYVMIRDHFVKTGTTVLYSSELRIAAILVREPSPKTEDDSTKKIN